MIIWDDLKDPMYIAIDFDGTIVEHKYPDIGGEVPGAIRWMKEFQAAGAKLILWTMRCDSESQGPVLTQAVEYCRKNGVEFYGINSNPGQVSWSNSPKAYAHIYIDDAAFGCPLQWHLHGGRAMVDWGVVGPTVLSHIEANKPKQQTKESPCPNPSASIP
jgi:hypothetical protein